MFAKFRCIGSLEATSASPDSPRQVCTWPPPSNFQFPINDRRWKACANAIQRQRSGDSLEIDACMSRQSADSPLDLNRSDATTCCSSVTLPDMQSPIQAKESVWPCAVGS